MLGVGQFKGGDAGLKGTVLKCAVALLFGKEIAAVGDDESHVARAGLVDAGEVDFVQNAVTQREPDFAVLVERRAGARLGAGGPARRNAGPARSIARGENQSWRLCPRSGDSSPAELTNFYRRDISRSCARCHPIVIVAAFEKWKLHRTERSRIIDHTSAGTWAKLFDARAWRHSSSLVACCALGLMATAEDVPQPAFVYAARPGFSGLYNLDFAGAQRDFSAWQQLHPDDPVGRSAKRQASCSPSSTGSGVLEAQFYENDEAFVDRPKLTPDPAPATTFHGRDRTGRKLFRMRGWPKIRRIATLYLP